MEYSTTSIRNIYTQDLVIIEDERGFLSYLEMQKELGVSSCRVFFIQTETATMRGGHAHRLCNQIFICNSGSLKIRCSDSMNSVEYDLKPNTYALFVPNGIWVDLEFQGPAQITVLCDQPYKEEEYVRDIESFILEKKIS